MAVAALSLRRMPAVRKYRAIINQAACPLPRFALASAGLPATMSLSPTPARHFALIPAAGVGSRIGADRPKQYLALAGKPMLLHALETFAATPLIAHAYLVVGADDPYIGEALAGADLAGRVTLLRVGGATRRQSVLNGLQAIRAQVDDTDWMLVHDAARPGLTTALIERLAGELADHPVGGLLALPVADTLKRAGPRQEAHETVAREGLWAAQTPQMFRYGLLKQALERAGEVTDEAGAIEALGLHPRLVEGSPRNFKVTLPQDLALAELYLKG
jgi:2-C-methyl-D-erythritol 4-phosphate cytidylyltransferase